MENLSLSVPDLLTTVKQFVDAEKHPQLDQMLQRYMCKELGKQQVPSTQWVLEMGLSSDSDSSVGVRTGWCGGASKPWLN